MSKKIVSKDKKVRLVAMSNGVQSSILVRDVFVVLYATKYKISVAGAFRRLKSMFKDSLDDGVSVSARGVEDFILYDSLTGREAASFDMNLQAIRQPNLF